MSDCKNPVVLVAVAEFDIDVGNTLSFVHPKGVVENLGLVKNVVADKCLPDGAHLHSEDWTILFVNVPDSSSPDKTQKLFGYAMFKNKPDASVRRGAIQKSMVAFTKVPLFDILEPILREAVAMFIVRTLDMARVIDTRKKGTILLKLLFCKISLTVLTTTTLKGTRLKFGGKNSLLSVLL